MRVTTVKTRGLQRGVTTVLQRPDNGVTTGSATLPYTPLRCNPRGAGLHASTQKLSASRESDLASQQRFATRRLKPGFTEIILLPGFVPQVATLISQHPRHDGTFYCVWAEYRTRRPKRAALLPMWVTSADAAPAMIFTKWAEITALAGGDHQ